MKTLLDGRTKLFLSVGTANLLALTTGMMLGWSSPILEKLKVLNDDNPLSTPITSTEESWIGSLLPLGATLGPFPFAFLQDKIGRKYALLLIAVPFTVAYFMAAFAQVVYLFFAVRLLAGLGVGATFTVLPTYIAEVSDVSVRGMLGASMTNFICLGILMTYSLGPYLSIMWFNIVEVFVPVVMVLLFYFFPETPYYLIDNSTRKKAENVLVTLRQTSVEEVQPELKQIEDSVMSSKSNRGTFFDIFKTKATTKAFAISTLLCIFQQLCGINIVLFYTQSIFEAAGSTLDSAIPPIIMAVVQLVASFMTPLLIDRWGRKALLLGSAVGMIVAEVPLGVYFHLQREEYDVESISWLPVVTLVIFIVTYNAGFGPIPWTVMAEIFPNNVKAVATSFTASSCNLVSFFLSFYYIKMAESIGIGAAFWICSGCAVLAFLFTFFYVPETKGKTFQEIQEILSS